MTRFLYALTLSAGLLLCPAAYATPLGVSDYADAEWQEREAEKRAERNGVIIVGMIAALVGGAALYQWGQELRDMVAPFVRRRPHVQLLVPVREDDYSDF